jgi:hypothetical protein
MAKDKDINDLAGIKEARERMTKMVGTTPLVLNTKAEWLLKAPSHY